jgi:prolyl oligopeptidase
MCPLVSPPFSPVGNVTDLLHGIPVADPYRWLEDQNSPETRGWIDEQTRYARAYLDGLAGRNQIRERIRQLLDVETYDSLIKSGKRYFFRKRLPRQEQPCIYFREGPDGEDQLLVDPATRGAGHYAAVKPLRVSLDGSLLLYEVKQGGERMGTFEILDVASRNRIPDSLPHGYLRGFAFAPDGKSYYYAHETRQPDRPFYRAAYQHILGTRSEADRQIFLAGEHEKLRLVLISDTWTLGFLVYRSLDQPRIDFYLWRMGSSGQPIWIVRDADYNFAPRLVSGRIFAIVDQDAPNRRIVEVQPRRNQDPLYFDLVPECDVPIRNWAITKDYIVLSYVRGTRSEIKVFDRFGEPVGEIPTAEGDTVRVAASSLDDNELLVERESFSRPVEILRCDIASGTISTWARRSVSIDPAEYYQIGTSFRSKDGTSIPIFLYGRRRNVARGKHPVVMTAYGGYGIPMTPQFSVLVSFLVERDCLFALPSIRGGSEFGTEWHEAAKRRTRQVAFDDFLSAAEWLIQTRRTNREKLAIFGGSNSGLLVGAAMTQRPDLFCAVLCMVPLLDMLRYHLFIDAEVAKDEFGTADDPEDFRALLDYSPYHAVREGSTYPATMIVSGDADQNCNPLHARKMTARLQAANRSNPVVILEYNQFRGHSPVLPLSVRLEALTDRLAFLTRQLQLDI